MPKKQFYKPNFIYFLLFGLAFFTLPIVNPISGQSGRRVRNAPPTPPVLETPAPTPTPSPKPTPKPTPQFSLRLVSDNRANTFSVITMPQDMSKYVAYRLETSLLLQIASNTSGSMKTAKQSAMNSESDYVVFIQFNENPFTSPQAAGTEQALRETYISFTVFTPKAGKAKLTGTAYFRPELLRNSGVLSRRQNCYGMMRDGDYLLMMASYEVAERIMSAFNLPIPQEKCGNTPTFFSSFAEI